ncbi:hypothetical protein R1flu_023595 [Riccia fluitans]|uniref:Armadillo repeat-containing protein 6 n=1 Tax=Riccia fluitans TaxID=41844 RepID=A0ABD1XSG9_9MARC
MAPAKKIQISQVAFDAVVKENVEEFGMDMDEALEDAVKTFKLQGVDLSGIITDGGGGATLESHPIVEAIQRIRNAVASVTGEDLATSEELVQFCNRPQTGAVNLSSAAEAVISDSLQSLRQSCLEEKGKNAPIAERNEGVEVVLAAVRALTKSAGPPLAYALAAITSVLTDNRRERFIRCNGPQILLEVLSSESASPDVVGEAANALAKSALQNEDVKDLYMHLKVYEVLVQQLQKYQSNSSVIDGVSTALRSLVTADDDRIAASRTFQNGMLIAKSGAIDTLLETAKLQGKHDPTLGPLCLAIKDLAVNDEICKSMAEKGGLNLVTWILETASREGSNRLLARTACILLIQLAGSDANKDAFVALKGLDMLVNLVSTFSSDPSIIQEALTAMAVITLRSPSNASQAVNSGAVDITAEMMETHASEANLQRQACQLIRNLAVRNPENRPIILEKGLEKLIRKAKATHIGCRDAASAALRDLGFDDYNK